MKTCISILFVIFFCVSCRAITGSSAPHSDAGHALISNFAKIAKNDYGLILTGQGGGFIDKVNVFSFTFISLAEMDKDDARRFYFQVLDRLLDTINTDSNLRQYLHHYPFTHHDVVLMISFRKPSDIYERPELPYVALVYTHQNIISYSVKGFKPNTLDNYSNESIQRARGIIQHQDMLKQIPQDCGWVR